MKNSTTIKPIKVAVVTSLVATAVITAKTAQAVEEARGPKTEASATQSQATPQAEEHLLLSFGCGLTCGGSCGHTAS
jgi:hypothetical protein